MRGTVDLIDQAKRLHGIPSDYALARELEVTRATISHYRNGKATLRDDVALRLAKMLKRDPAFVLACIHGERADLAGDEALARTWHSLAARLARGC